MPKPVVTRGLFLVPLLAVLLSAQPGCGASFGTWFSGGPSEPSRPIPTDAQLTDVDSAELPWARDEEFFIVVSRPCHRVDVFRRGRLIRRYPAVFGMNNKGGKLYEGDLRTPAGFYTIVDKWEHPRWARFLLIDYPNATDAYRYAEAVQAGKVPKREGQVPGIGGAIGIHGSDKEDLNEDRIDWTLGCVSLSNRDVVDLDALVPLGTPVLIME